MCILFVAIERHKDYPLIICANRDEFYARPTQAACFWPEHPSVFAGKDLQAGGSWLGVNRQGQFAAITNIRTKNSNQGDLKSRGELVVKSLTEQSLLTHDWLIKHSASYNPFNLIYGPLNDLRCFNSRNAQLKKLTPGYHAISNGDLDDNWPKMTRGIHKLEENIHPSKSIVIDKLLTILKDESKAEFSHLPDTGIARDWELLLSSIFITSDSYGTRSSSIILLDRKNNIQFFEAEYDDSGQQVRLNEFLFSSSLS